MDGVQIRGFGFENLQQQLDRLPDKVHRRITGKALNKAATHIVKDARRRVPVDTGTLKKSIGKKLKKYPSGIAVVIVGPRIKIGKWAGQHGWLVEHGSGPRETSSGKSTGTMPAQPFMRPAFDSQLAKVLATIKKEVAAGIIKEAKRV